MSNKTVFSRLALLGFLLILGLSTASAASIEIKEGKTIWAHSGHDMKVSGDLSCSAGESTVKMKAPDGTMFNAYEDNESFKKDFDVDTLRGRYGQYNAEVSCKSATDSESFTVKHFSVNRLEPNSQIDVYRGNDFSFKLKGFVNGNYEALDNSNAEFSAELLNGGSLDTRTQGVNDGTTVEATVPEDLTPGEKALLTTVEYKKDGGIRARPSEGPMKIDVNPTWQTKVVNATPEDRKLSYQNLEDLQVDVRVTKKGEKYNRLGSEDFYLTITDKQQEGNNTVVKNYKKADMMTSAWKGDGKYRLKMSKIPSLPLGRYGFTVGMDKASEPIANFTVSKYILLSGKITDAAGQPVGGKINVDKKGFKRRIPVKNGKYSENVLPGSYNFTLDFPEAKMSLEGVTLKESKNTVREGRAIGDIRYDDIPIGKVSQSLEGVTVANAVAVWFGYEFEDGRMSLSYDTSKVNPSNLQVYECVGWNLNAVSCYSTSSWKKVEIERSDIHPTVGSVTFPVNAYNQTGSQMVLNGYMVVRNTPMELESFSMDTDRVPKGDQLGIEGKIETPNGDNIQGANVKISILDMEGDKVGETYSFASNGNGVFSGMINTPQEEGNYKLKVNAEKKPYSEIEKTLDRNFETYTSTGVTLQAPSTSKFYVGSKSESQYTIINSGQAPVKDVRITVKGFSNENWNFSRSKWDKLGPGESISTTLTTKLPSDYCSSSCRKYKNIKVETTGQADGKVNDMVSVQAQVMKDAKKTGSKKSSSNEDSSGSSFAPSLPSTGKFLEKQSDFNMILGIIVVFVLVLVAAVKKKNNNGRGGRNVLDTDYSGGAASRGTMRKGKPDVGSSEEVIEVEPSEATSDSSQESSSADEKPELESEGEDSVIKCNTCGEKFDTDAALEIHEKTVH